MDPGWAQPMSDSGNTSSLVRNTVAQSAPLLLGYFFSLVSAPVIVAGLGIRQFGIWALTGGLAQYAALLNFGAGQAVSRYIAANEDDERICGEYMGVGVLSVAVVGLGLIPAAILGAGPLAATLHGITPDTMRAVLLSSASVLLASLVVALAAAYPVGMRRMVAPNLGMAIGAVLSFVASVVAIALGAGLRAYAYANAGAAALSALVVIGLVLRAEGSIPMAWPSWPRVGEFLRFSVKTQLVRWADLVNYQTDKVVIALAVGPSAAGAYELANRVAMAARGIGVYPLSALLPTLSADVSRFGIAQVRRRYRRLVTVTVSIGLPPLIFIAAIAPLLLDAWLAHVPANATMVLAILSVAYVANVSSGVSYVIGAAAGAPGIAARAATGTAVLNLVMTATLAPLFGIWGVLAGTAVALTGGALAQIVMVHRRFSLALSSYRDAVVPTLAVSALLAAPIALLAYSRVLTGRGVEVAAVLVMTVAYLLAYARWAVRSGRVPETVGRRLPGLTWPIRA